MCPDDQQALVADNGHAISGHVIQPAHIVPLVTITGEHTYYPRTVPDR